MFCRLREFPRAANDRRPVNLFAVCIVADDRQVTGPELSVWGAAGAFYSAPTPWCPPVNGTKGWIWPL
jgi:hypothetical protein